MGQIVRRKKKGRPSKADLAKRRHSAADKEAAGRELRRSGRQRGVRYTFDLDDYLDDDELFEEFEDDEEDERRREKKLKLLLKLQSNSSSSKENNTPKTAMFTESAPSRARRVSHAHTASESSEECRGDGNNPSKKRRTSGQEDAEDEEEDENDEIDEEDNVNVEDEEVHKVGKAEPKRMDLEPGTPTELPSGLPMPEKKVAELLLDKLQKKDIYGVYAEPVDPEELPDYHEVIEHPMDFATVRNKLESGTYATLEQFENDVFLICSNAMQYNSPDTVYYKQARNIQELAKRKFEKLRFGIGRSENVLKSDQKTSISSIMNRPMKKPPSRALQNPLGSDFSSGATLATAEDFQNGSSAAQAGGCDRASSVDRLVEGSVINDNVIDKADDSIPGKRLPPRTERKPSHNDEMSRATYEMSIEPSTSSESIFSAFEGESKHLIPVGVYVDHSYARSLARYASVLGPVAWKIASSRIEQALPSDCKFGRGWVGEYEPLPTPVLMVETCTVKEPSFFKKFDQAVDTIRETNPRKLEPVGEKPFERPHVENSGRSLFTCNNRQAIEPNLDIRSTFPSPAAVKPIAIPHSGLSMPSKEQTIRFPGWDGRSSPFGSPGIRPHISATPGFQQPRNFMEAEKKVVKQVGVTGLSPHSQSTATFSMQRQILNSSELPGAVPVEPLPMSKNLLHSGSFRPPNNNAVGVGGLADRKARSVDSNRMATSSSDGAKTAAYFSNGQEKQGLTDPVQLMRALAEKAQNQQRSSIESPIDTKSVMHPSPIMRRDDSSNAAAAAARAWMSVGAGGLKLTGENMGSHKSHISADSLNNSAHDFQPQASRFRGEHPSYGMHFQPEKSTYSLPFVPQPSRIVAEGQFRNQLVPQLITADLSRFQSQWQSGNPQMQARQKLDSLPPDLNISFPSSGSPGRPASSLLVDSQQPDLALQL